ncbi:recombinase family protein [Xylanimonas ulmi]|uniref:DNA invertase Pin-like site-specific DNA recombinase n=1 Tax=Xylanimonas ulmi TaxID=228973 RepID=A0A4V2EY39_9MICO|nr:recombinase family protein [Xylanibacterium ulmi]RZS61650.1 DNA invertase Pin-like site-specific DNA recombinase [Xylanibacterium ulmi]
MRAASKLRAVADPAARRRGVGVIRVSREGGRGDKLASPQIQRAAIVEHANRHGIDVVDWVEAIDESGSRAKSAWWPRLDAQIERVEAGEVDVIVAWEFSRHARNRLRWAVALDRVEAAGGNLESATEPVDVTTAAGRFQRGVLAEMHAYKAEAIGEGWQQVQANRVRNGLPPGGKLPWGWRWADDGGAVEADPDKGPYVVEAYRRYLAGAGARDLARWLNDSGVRPMHAAVWAHETITQCLDSPVHAGMVSYRGQAWPGAHEGLVDVATWEAYRVERERRAGEREVKRRYLLSGIAMCPCTDAGTPMNGFTVTKASRARGGTPRRFVSYRCVTLGRTPGHGSWSMTARIVEGALTDWLGQVAADVENRAPKAAQSADVAAAQARTLRAERDRIDLALTNLTVQHALGTYPDGAYASARDQMVGRRAQLDAEVRALERAAVSVPDDPAGIAAGLLTEWDELPLEQVRQVVRRLVRGVVVDYGARSASVWPVWETRRPW